MNWRGQAHRQECTTQTASHSVDHWENMKADEQGLSDYLSSHPNSRNSREILMSDSNPQAETRDLKRREEEEEKHVGKDNTICVLEREDARSRDTRIVASS